MVDSSALTSAGIAANTYRFPPAHCQKPPPLYPAGRMLATDPYPGVGIVHFVFCGEPTAEALSTFAQNCPENTVDYHFLRGSVA